MTMDIAVPALSLAIVVMGVQQGILIAEIYQLRRELRRLIGGIKLLNAAVNPWGEDEPTQPGLPPRATQRVRAWLHRQLKKRPHSPD